MCVVRDEGVFDVEKVVFGVFWRFFEVFQGIIGI
jgi:hypothetical protein